MLRSGDSLSKMVENVVYKSSTRLTFVAEGQLQPSDVGTCSFVARRMRTLFHIYKGIRYRFPEITDFLLTYLLFLTLPLYPLSVRKEKREIGKRERERFTRQCNFPSVHTSLYLYRRFQGIRTT